MFSRNSQKRVFFVQMHMRAQALNLQSGFSAVSTQKVAETARVFSAVSKLAPTTTAAASPTASSAAATPSVATDTATDTRRSRSVHLPLPSVVPHKRWNLSLGAGV